MIHMQQIVAEAEIHADLAFVRALLILMGMGLLGAQGHKQRNRNGRYQCSRLHSGSSDVVGEPGDRL